MRLHADVESRSHRQRRSASTPRAVAPPRTETTGPADARTIAAPQRTAGNAAVARALRGPGDAPVQRARRRSDSTDSVDSPAFRAEVTFDMQKKVLWDRVNEVHALSRNPGFRKAVAAFLEAVHADVRRAAGGETRTTEVDHGVVDAIITGLQHPHVLGHRLQYRWYVRNQRNEGFYESLAARAQEAASHGSVWSKLGAAEPIERAQVGRAVVLESSVQGYLFNGLLFGLPNWSASPTLQALWKQLSQTYSRGLEGWVDAHVLEGRDDTSVLATIEWPELRQRIGRGVEGMNVVVYRPVRDPDRGVHDLEPVDMYQVRSDEDFAALPAVPGDQAWRDRQTAVDRDQKTRLTDEVEPRETALDQLADSLEQLAATHGIAKEMFRFRLSETPANTPHATMDA
ncbi:hypothetical protein ACQZOG_06860 [Streptomyces sp. P13-3-3]|uniref:hypothetical protein n=1 Tax=Streptomyces sp. P13-3-3 TaxID=3423222 RepID=UPI003D3349E9